jgi:hypothetical protein
LRFALIARISKISTEPSSNVQPIGEIYLPTGVQNLDKPGINLLSTVGENDDPWAYPTIYWNERVQTFYSITKAND